MQIDLSGLSNERSADTCKGVGGILISTAKSVLTTLCAGIHPYRTLSVVLDCGTDVRKSLV